MATAKSRVVVLWEGTEAILRGAAYKLGWVLGAVCVLIIAVAIMIGTVFSNESHVRGPHIKVIHVEQSK